jgi:hypothetical protein
MSHTELPDEPAANPISLIEQLAATNEWTAERSGDNEIALSSPGKWCDYHVSFQWMGEIEALHIACAFDLPVPDLRYGEVLKLLAMLNEQQWIGHFDLWPDEKMVMYRNALLLPHGSTLISPQCEAMLTFALEAGERAYPALQLVIWAGKSAKEALDEASFETQGNA